MAASEAQKRANERYRKRAIVSKTIAFFPKDKELLDHAMAQADKSFAEYVRNLIRKDLEEKKAEQQNS